MLKISNIQRFSVDDGPGIRTTVFLKGCNLRCQWCHNPENLEMNPSLQFKKENCINCGRCQEACPNDVHEVDGDSHKIHYDRCIGCGQCANNCITSALKIVGEDREIERIVKVVLRDHDFYQSLGGGVTFSGGEPMLQHEQLKRCLKECKKYGLHTAIDTAGAVPFEWFESLMPYTDLFLYDLKCYSERLHRTFTGIGNQIIKDNIKKLGERGGKIIIRTPLIDGFNTSLKEMEFLAEFISHLDGIRLHQLLPYHDYGMGKYEALGKQYARGLKTPELKIMQKILSIFEDKSIPVKLMY